MAISADQWALVASAIPGFGRLPDPGLVRTRMQVLEVDRPTRLPADGLYVVLDGRATLSSGGAPVAVAHRGHYFYEEYLVLEDVPVELRAHAAPGARFVHLPNRDWTELPEDVRATCLSSLFGDLVNVHLHDFQQPVNCCNITAAALSLTALGFPADVDDIFRKCSLPVSYVVNDGLTLGELYDVACTYVHAAGLRRDVGVQAYYFDAAVSCERELRDAIAESDRVGGQDDILVANFDVGLAHGRSDISGGHYALIAKCNRSTGLVHMMDVHPEKYGKLWVTTTDRLYEALAARDGRSRRSRGLMRFVARDALNTRLETLQRDAECVDGTHHFSMAPGKRGSLFSRYCTHLNGLCMLSVSLGMLGKRRVDEDDVLDAANVSYSDALTYEATADGLADLANQYLASVGIEGLSCYPVAVGDDFRDRLLALGEGGGRHYLVDIDFNAVVGYEAIAAPQDALLGDYWCICVHYDADTDMVTLADKNPATTRTWRVPRARLLRGVRRAGGATMLVVERERVERNAGVREIVAEHRLVLFYSDNDSWSYMLKSILGNIGATELHTVNVGGCGTDAMRLRKQLVSDSGKDRVPYLYFDGTCLGETDDIVDMVRTGAFQRMLDDAGLPVLLRDETPSLDNNIYSYPKGGLTDAPNGKRNILLAACGSSAADKIPELVERLVDAGHNVKLVPSVAAERFFRDFGMERILAKIKPSDIYRDDDEWNFRYTEYGMPLRAAHLALCDWADCMVVAPITCNTMGKVSHGVADSILTSVFVAWQYQKKPVILCPACNTNMWNNLTTQDNVTRLKRLGCHFEGPRSGILSNGTTGIGMMATPEEIMTALEVALGDLDDPGRRVIKWGREAAAADDHREWRRIYRAIDEGVVGVNVVCDDTGDTLLHFAAGGEGKMSHDGIEKGVPDIEAAQALIERGIDVNIANDYAFTSLHVAMMNGSAQMCRILLDAGADGRDCLRLLYKMHIGGEVRELLLAWAEERGVGVEADAASGRNGRAANGARHLYFAYGSLKRGFPNYGAHAEILGDLVGEATTRQAMPLVVPHEPYCSNDRCPYLHRMAALVDVKGSGHKVRGELFRVDDAGLRALDELEGYRGPRDPANVYERKLVSVVVDGEPMTAFAYVIADPEPHLAALEQGSAEAVVEYTRDMATGVLKPAAATGTA